MKRIIYLVFLFLLTNCNEKESEGYLTAEKAKAYFGSVREICDKDAGKLWGKNLYGPLMYVDRTTRKITANQQDNEGILKEKDGVFTGFFPREQIIPFGAFTLGGTLFATAPLPPEEDEFRMKWMAVRSLYRCFAVNSGIPVSSFYLSNMDERDARLWVKLEWKALRKAIGSEGEARRIAIRDALIFRGSNRELYPSMVSEANRFETNEGLATFTHTLLCTNSCEEFRTRLLENYDRFYAMPSYSRSFGYMTGALYATLLHDSGFDLRSIHSDNYDLGSAVRIVYNIDLPEVCRDVAGSIALSYNLDAINAEEEERLANIRESIHKQVSIFTEKPVVYLELESPYFDFEQEDIHPLDTLGTLYTSMRVSDNWGKLTVNGDGCLVSSNFKYVRITAKGFRADKNRYTGDGWQLLLNSEWEVIKVEQNYFVRKLMP
ncbi:MAG: hypothetical protein MUD02_03795 [Bacteroidales bacterium]|nr:hypothetical protein [Bacteroidales bacterium]